MSNYVDNTVSQIDLTAPTIPAGTGPLGVAAGPDGQLVWISNSTGNSVSKIRVTDNTVLDTIGVGTAPYGLAVTPDGSYVFVANSGDDTVSRINTATGLEDSVIPVGDDPRGVDITPDGVYVIVANHGDNTISRIAVATSSATVLAQVGTQPVALGRFITPEVRAGAPDEGGDGLDPDTRPPGGPAHQFGGGGENIDPPIPPNYTWHAGDGDTVQNLTMALAYTGETGAGASADVEAMDIQVPGLMFRQTCPTGETQECWLPLGQSGTTPGGMEYSTQMRWNYDVRVIDVNMAWPQEVIQTMAAGKHCLTYYLQTEDGRQSNCRVGYLDCNPETGTVAFRERASSGVALEGNARELNFNLQLSYFNPDTGFVERLKEGMCEVETEEGSWGTFPILDGMLTFTIPFGVTSEIKFTAELFKGTKTVRIEFKDGYMYAYDQDHRDATVEVYQCVDGESYALEYYQDLVYICNQGVDPDGPILGRMFGK